MPPLLRFERVTYRYPATRPDSTGLPARLSGGILALSDVSLSIEEGEFVAVVGANGSGKSTFARLAGALLLPTEGTVQVNGMETANPANRSRVHALVGMVFQFPEDQIISTTVEEDVAFGPENMALPPAEIRSRVEDALHEVGLVEMRQRPPHLLSAGQTQRLALAGVLAMRPRCIIFDEASTMLDPSGRRTLLEAMQRLHREGVTIIFITHFMEEAALAERIVVFSRGKVAIDGSPNQVFADPGRLEALNLHQPAITRLANALRSTAQRMDLSPVPEGILSIADLQAAVPVYPVDLQLAKVENKQDDEAPQQHKLAIDVSNLHHTYMIGTPLAHPALDGASIQVVEGSVHGLIGKTGSGKSTLMQHLNALLRPQEGSIHIAGFDLSDPQVSRREVVRQVGLVFQNPEAQFFEYYVGDEIAYGPEQLAQGQDEGEESLAERVRWAMEQVGLDFAAYKDRPLFSLSGGERRKVALASILALKPKILLLDEPTAGLDPQSRLDLLDRLAALRAGGMTLLISSHQMDDLAVLACRLTVFFHGKDVLSGPAAALFSNQTDLQEYAMEPPTGVQVANVLRARGWPVPEDILSIAALEEWITRAGEREAQ